MKVSDTSIKSVHVFELSVVLRFITTAPVSNDKLCYETSVSKTWRFGINNLPKRLIFLYKIVFAKTKESASKSMIL